MNCADMTDSELATCVDEYVKRIRARAASLGYDNGQINISVMAFGYQSEKEYEIDHSVTIGGYSHEIKVKSNNALAGVERAVARWREDNNFPPTKVQPMLCAPTPPSEPEYTEFAVVEENNDDDVPF